MDVLYCCAAGRETSLCCLKAPFSPAAKPSGPRAAKVVVGVVVFVQLEDSFVKVCIQVRLLLFPLQFSKGGIHILWFFMLINIWLRFVIPVSYS